MRPISFALVAFAFAWAACSDAWAYTETVVHKFCARSVCKDGAGPVGALARDQNGRLYGVTEGGLGATDQGAVYELVPSGSRWKTNVLHRFSGDETSQPASGVILDANGNLYGVTGTQIYELMPNADRSKWKFKALYTFCPNGDCAGGSEPIDGLSYMGAESGLPYDGVSPLYGMTTEGGAYDSGVVYQLSPNGTRWREKVLHDFCTQSPCSDGFTPYGNVLVTQDGLFGVTFWGGNNECDVGCGVVFQLIPRRTRDRSDSRWKEVVLYESCTETNCADSAHLMGVASDGAGDLIVTANSGGASNEGSILKITPNGENSPYIVLHSFCSACGETTQPDSAVTIDETGALFGEAGDAPGAVYRLDESVYTTLHRFCALKNCHDGDYPFGGLTLEPSGNLFGTTLGGGYRERGTVFDLEP